VISERSLVAQCRTGDHAAFTGLIHRNSLVAIRAIRSIVSNPADAEDIMQEQRSPPSGQSSSRTTKQDRQAGAAAITRTEHDDATGEDSEREIHFLKGWPIRS
jgi:hypothetical protein